MADKDDDSGGRGQGEAGAAVDSEGRAAQDPTKNVLDLTRAAVHRLDDVTTLQVKRLDDLRAASQQRQDDLRDMEVAHFHEILTLRADYEKQYRECESSQQRRKDDLHSLESSHVRELLALDSKYQELLRQAETKRIDAVRSVDVAAVAEAARVSAAQALTLANQVSTTAETNRTQVAAVAAATGQALANALEPIIRQLAELSQKQYELQGQKQAQVESKGDFQSGRTAMLSIVGLCISLLSVAIVFAAYIATHK